MCCMIGLKTEVDTRIMTVQMQGKILPGRERYSSHTQGRVPLCRGGLHAFLHASERRWRLGQVFFDAKRAPHLDPVQP